MTKRDAVDLLIAFALIAGILYWLQFITPSICCGDFDGYYHIRLSRVMWEGIRNGDFPPSFTWLPLTTLDARDYADQHFLFHLLLVPFTWFGNLTKGAKIAVVLFSTLAVLSCYWLLLRYQIRYPFLWLLALTTSSADFLFRLNMARASSVSILYMIIAIGLLFARKYVWLAPLGFLYAWTYNLFLFLGVITVMWVAAAWWGRRRIEWGAPLWAGGGMLAGMVINPYFPHDFTLLFEHIFAKAGAFSIAVGTEWYSLPAWALVKHGFVACAAAIIGYMGGGYLLGLEPDQRCHTERPLFFLLFSNFLLLLTVRSQRFTEYWPPFAVLCAAFTLAALRDVRSERRPALSLEDSRQSSRARTRVRALAVTSIVVVLVVAAVYNVGAAREAIRSTEEKKAPDHYSRGMTWVREHIPVGALIFNVNWSDFPKLFFYDLDHTYVAGLDPIYLLDKNPELARLYERINSGQEADPASLIPDRFGARYVMVGNRFAQGFYPAALKTNRFEKIYEDTETVILQILR